MRFSRLSIVASSLACISLAAATGLHAAAQSPLRSIPGPNGGTIVYGTVDGATTPAAAMGSVLKNLHRQYGDRPLVGRVFRVRGTESNAVFLTLTRRSPTTLKIAGMLLVSNAPGHVEAALLTDDAVRFGSSINPMLQTLFATWKPGGKSLQGPHALSGGGAMAVAPAAPATPLRPYRLQDGSASVMLAEGWRVAAGSGGGTILAQGPRGETMALGFPYLAYNSNDPRTMQMRQFAASPSGRNTIYAKALFVPYGAELGRTFVELNTQARRVGSPAVATVQVSRVQPVQTNGAARCAILSGNAEGQGQQALQVEGTFCQGPQDGRGGFMNLANLVFAPAGVAAGEQSTLRAMLASFQVNQSVVNAQAAALAGPVVEAIHQIGRDVDARIRESDRQNDERRAAFDAHNDAMDRSSQGFSNYILDKSVILDNQNNAHGTMWNDTAAALVQSDPNRFEYVDTPGYWKGIDY
jgi:hypothetical protein